MDGRRHLFFLLNNAFLGFSLSGLYGAGTALVLWHFGSLGQFRAYHEAFFVNFNCAVSGALVFTTYLLVLRTKNYIPTLIRQNFTSRELETTDYYTNERRFFSLARTLAHSSSYALLGLLVFYAARFPFRGWAEYFLMAFGATQYALGVYVGRKLFYIAQMVRAIDGLKIKKDLFSEDRLGGILVYVNAISTLTVILVFVGVKSYYEGPFEYQDPLGRSAKALMLVPAIIAIPVLVVFNYYPRGVIRRLYEQSISHLLSNLKRKHRDKELSYFERLAYIAEYEKVTRDELKYRLRMSLTDLPMAITLGLAILGLVFKA